VSVFSVGSLREPFLAQPVDRQRERERLTDIGEAVAAAGGWRGWTIRSTRRWLTSVSPAPRNRLVAVAGKPAV
jgi:hypothetical protein